MFLYQVLEIFETKYIGGCILLLKGLGVGFFLSDFLIEIVMIMLSLCIFMKGIVTVEIYGQKILGYIYDILKDLIKGLSVQQISSSNNIITFFILNIFMLLLFFNLYGLLPLSYSLTSQLSVTIFLSFSVCFGVTLIGFLNMGYNYLYLFITNEGEMPMLIVPFLILIEFLSYIARYFSLGLRLFANMMAGHSLMVILSKFFLGFFDKFINIFDIVLMVLLSLMLSIVLLEIGVSFLQAYVFVLLISIYLSESTSYNSLNIENK